MENVGERIKMLRKKLGLTQSELAQKLGLECAAISKYETNRVPLTQDSLLRLAEVFNVTTDYILTGKRTINEPIEIAANMGDKADLSEMTEKDKQFILDMIERLKGKGK